MMSLIGRSGNDSPNAVVNGPHASTIAMIAPIRLASLRVNCCMVPPDQLFSAAPADARRLAASDPAIRPNTAPFMTEVAPV